MVTISVCLETYFTNLPVDERIAKIAEAGYRCVEFWHPEGTLDGATIRTDWAKDPAALRRACERHGVTLNDFAMHAWDGSIGGCPVKPQDRDPLHRADPQDDRLRRSGRLPQRHHAFRHGRSRAFQERDAQESGGRVGRSGETRRAGRFHPAAGAAQHAGGSSGLLSRLLGRGASKSFAPSAAATSKSSTTSITCRSWKETSWRRSRRTSRGSAIFMRRACPAAAKMFSCELNYPDILAKIESLGYQGAFGLEYFPKLSDHDQSLRETLAYLSNRPPERSLAIVLGHNVFRTRRVRISAHGMCRIR